jgi:DNA-binding NarL/FixJ family response regulator
MNLGHCVEPISHDPTNPAAKSPQKVVPIHTLAKRILVVDDNPTMRAALRFFIETCTSMRVSEARDGAEAVERAEVQKPDVAIIDLVMPNVNGLEAASVIRSRLPEVRIVVFTLHSDVIGVALAKAIGVDVVVSKSDGATGLIKALQTIWAENAPS